ncbi:MAG: response regulator [Spirochaetales bacterium]|jgi:putative two-component system response regulator|nr:response regulator [Spirochaetales bacterium]
MSEERSTVMLVDDDEVHLNAGKNILKNLYNVFPIPSGKKLFDMLEKVMPDLILLDVEMPDVDGYEVIKKLKTSSKTADIPVIFLTAHIDPGHELEGLSLGAVDYIYKPFSPILLIRRIENHIFIAQQKKELKHKNEALQTTALEKTVQVVDMENAILNTIAELLEFRTELNTGHITRIQKYLRMMIDRLISEKIYTDTLSQWNLAFLVPAAQLHDVGKIMVNETILNKPGLYTEEEFELVKHHAEWGAKIIESMENQITGHSFLHHAKIMAASHHEKWDGSGYPKGLKEEAIPLQGRLMAIADVYDALISKLPYKEALPAEDAKKIIIAGRATHFDPVLVEVFEALSDQFEYIARTTSRGADPEAPPA